MFFFRKIGLFQGYLAEKNITYHFSIWIVWYDNVIHDGYYDQPCLLSQDFFLKPIDFKGEEARKKD